ncbi:MAG TPA: zinc-dependent alcohol dehydrogenase, partial [Allosphingosinicella sp.]
VRVDTVPDPRIADPTDVLIRVTSTAICGSDLHLYDGFMPTMQEGDVVGHEPMGVVVEAGKEVKKLKKGDRVVVPFTISCGNCWFCQRQMFSLCDTSNPNAEIAKKVMGQSPAALFGYSHMLGGFAGGQAQYLRVPYADVGPVKIPDGMPDEKVLFLSDVFPTGYMAAEQAEIEPGDTVAVWGCGPVGLFAIQSALIMGAHRVIAIDHFPHRLELAKGLGAEVLNFREADVRDALWEMTGGIGPDACIDCVGMEAHGLAIDNIADTVKAHTFLGTDRPAALRQAILACRKGGRVSVPGVYGGMADKFPIGAFMEKGLTMKTGQTHVQKYTKTLLAMIEEGKIDTTFLVSHHASLENGPDMYRHWHDEQDSYTKIVLRPGMEGVKHVANDTANQEKQHEPA